MLLYRNIIIYILVGWLFWFCLTFVISFYLLISYVLCCLLQLGYLLPLFVTSSTPHVVVSFLSIPSNFSIKSCSKLLEKLRGLFAFHEMGCFSGQYMLLPLSKAKCPLPSYVKATYFFLVRFQCNWNPYKYGGVDFGPEVFMLSL